MAALKQRGRRWWAKVRIPRELIDQHEGRQHLERNLRTSDRRAAEAEAKAWEAMLRMDWADKLGVAKPEAESLRAAYARVREQAVLGEFAVDQDGADPALAGIDFEIEKIAERVGETELSRLDAARLAALNDAAREIQGRPVPRRNELEPDWADLASDYMKLWQTQHGLKPSNTAAQKRATYGLFGAFWKGRPIRGVRKKDAATFVDALRQMDPHWARTPDNRKLSWSELQERFGNRPKGMSDATINRHMATLKSLWEWARDRDYCEGRNPFAGFHRKVSEGRNKRGYLPWTDEELAVLWSKPPKRVDVQEVMAVAMFTGMRLDEIASLTWGQVREDDGVPYFDVRDAKTRAGNRHVPVHPALSWLLERKRQDEGQRVWPTFNLEGPGKKPGADAGREFSRVKIALGFDDRRKVFHSFRKNVTRQMERAGVRDTEWAEIVGHEKGMTYGVYNPDGLDLKRKAEIIAVIRYPGLTLPDFSSHGS